MSLGSIDVDELLERMTEDNDQVTFGDYVEDDFESSEATESTENDSEESEESEDEEIETPRLDLSRLHPSFHDFAPSAESAYAALLTHLPSCSRWSRWFGRCPSVEVTGHGLGGALAVLISDHTPHRTKVTTFGMPAIYDAEGRHEHWANGLDPVTRFLPGAGRRLMKDAKEAFHMAKGRLADHNVVHGVSLEC